MADSVSKSERVDVVIGVVGSNVSVVGGQQDAATGKASVGGESSYVPPPPPTPPLPSSSFPSSSSPSHASIAKVGDPEAADADADAALAADASVQADRHKVVFLYSLYFIFLNDLTF